MPDPREAYGLRRLPPLSVVFVFVRSIKAALPCRRDAECPWDFSRFEMKSERRVFLCRAEETVVVPGSC